MSGNHKGPTKILKRPQLAATDGDKPSTKSEKDGSISSEAAASAAASKSKAVPEPFKASSGQSSPTSSSRSMPLSMVVKANTIASENAVPSPRTLDTLEDDRGSMRSIEGGAEASTDEMIHLTIENITNELEQMMKDERAKIEESFKSRTKELLQVVSNGINTKLPEILKQEWESQAPAIVEDMKTIMRNAIQDSLKTIMSLSIDTVMIALSEKMTLPSTEAADPQKDLLLSSLNQSFRIAFEKQVLPSMENSTKKMLEQVAERIDKDLEVRFVAPLRSYMERLSEYDGTISNSLAAFETNRVAVLDALQASATGGLGGDGRQLAMAISGIEDGTSFGESHSGEESASRLEPKIRALMESNQFVEAIRMAMDTTDAVRDALGLIIVQELIFRETIKESDISELVKQLSVGEGREGAFLIGALASNLALNPSLGKTMQWIHDIILNWEEYVEDVEKVHNHVILDVFVEVVAQLKDIAADPDYPGYKMEPSDVRMRKILIYIFNNHIIQRS
mmetsp:Transcript_22669/g.39120  ORF Transcript_22669/g.39120 Transcript_22669/m.39120 type:complete len:509 (+) Transcript_22669:54-1580(+)